MLKIFTTNILLILTFSICYSQTEIETSNKGAPIFTEDFGNKTTGANRFDIGNTSYEYVKNKTPYDGSYTISSRFNWYPAWFITKDHTPNDNRGKALIVNADRNKSGIFFSRKIKGLCPGSTYEFSAWMMNISSSDYPECKIKTGIPGGIPIDVRFEIWDGTNSKMIKKITTGKIYAQSSPKWIRHNIIFKIPQNQETVILKIANNGQGGCGNDLALDDIQFTPYGDSVKITSNSKKESPLTLCSNYKKGLQLTASTQNKFFQQTYFQWQHSTDGKNYRNIPEQEKEVLYISKSAKTGNNYYRVKIAENKNTLNKPFCNVISNPYIVKIVDTPKLTKKLPEFEFSETDSIEINISKYTDAINVKWYDSITNGTLLKSSKKTLKNNTFLPGDHTVFVQLSSSTCFPKERIPINFKVLSKAPKTPEPIEIPEQIEVPKPAKTIEPSELEAYVNLQMCLGDEVILDAGIDGYYYDWSTEEYEKTITIYEPGKYVVTITHEKDEDYLFTRTFYVKGAVGPVINRVICQEDNSVKVFMREAGEYEYSANGKDFQKSNVFKGLKNGAYLFYARYPNDCQAVSPAFQFIKL